MTRSLRPGAAYAIDLPANAVHEYSTSPRAPTWPWSTGPSPMAPSVRARSACGRARPRPTRAGKSPSAIGWVLRCGGGLIAGARGELLTLVAPEAAAAPDPSAALAEHIWQLWAVNAERGTARVHVPLLTTANPRWMRLDNRLYLRVPEPSGVGDTLFDISDAPEPVAGIRLPSANTNVVRFR